MAEVDWRQMSRAEAITYLTEDLGVPDRDADRMWAIASGLIAGDAVNLQGEDPLQGVQLKRSVEAPPDTVVNGVTLPASATPAQLDKIMPALLRSLLASGDKGYKDTIDALEPEPSQANNWCFDQSTEQYQGTFLSDTKRLAYTIKQEGGQWTVTTGLEGGSEFAEAIALSGDTDLLDDAEWDALAAGVSDPDVISEAMEAIALLDNQ